MSETIVQLRRGLEFLRANKWGQCHYFVADYSPDARPEFTRFCLIGAMSRGNGMGTGAFEESGAYRSLQYEVAVRKLGREQVSGHELDMINLAVWNDEPGRTKDEVVSLVEKVLRDCEAVSRAP